MNYITWLYCVYSPGVYSHSSRGGFPIENITEVKRTLSKAGLLQDEPTIWWLCLSEWHNQRRLRYKFSECLYFWWIGVNPVTGQDCLSAYRQSLSPKLTYPGYGIWRHGNILTQPDFARAKVCKLLKKRAHSNIATYIGCNVQDGRIRGLVSPGSL
jgi:hypothetical protein